MITTQILQCIDQELRDLNNRGFIARLFNRNARFELNLIRKTVLNLKSVEELKLKVKEPQQLTEREMLIEYGKKENASLLKCLDEISRYWSGTKGKVMPSYIERVIKECNEQIDKDHLEYLDQRINFYAGRLADLKNAVAEL